MDLATWLVLIDFDDTQIPTAYRFIEANLQCGHIVARSLRPRPPLPQTIFAKHYEIDSALVESLGYGFKRYVDSWTRTYLHFAEEARLTPDPSVAGLIESIAAEIFRGPFIPFDGVKETLEALRKDGHDLHIISAGEPEYQLPKIKASGLEPMFASVHITPHGKREAMETIIGARRQRVMMVGDSLRGDIAPAIEIGIVAVHVIGDPWTYGHVPLDPDSYHRIQSLSELPALIRALEAAMTHT